MKKHKQSSKVKTFFKALDIYAKPINLTYKGKEKFASFCGGLVSSLVILLVISLLVYDLKDLILKN